MDPEKHPGATPPEDMPEGDDPPKEKLADNIPKGMFEALYEKIPLTYRQVDILVKVLIGLLAVILIIGVATGSGIGGG